MPKREILYQETYKPGAMTVQEALLPDRFPYMPAEARIVSIEMLKAGREMVDGEKLEFQDVRVRVRLDPPGGDM